MLLRETLLQLTWVRMKFLQDSADAATAAAGVCNCCVDEYTCNAPSGDASPIDMVWETASENTTSAEESSLETAMPNGQI